MLLLFLSSRHSENRDLRLNTGVRSRIVKNTENLLIIRKTNINLVFSLQSSAIFSETVSDVMTAMRETEMSRTKFRLQGTARVTNSSPSPSPGLLSFVAPAALGLPAQCPREGATRAHAGGGIRAALPAAPRDVGRGTRL